jgi:ribosomal protein S11
MDPEETFWGFCTAVQSGSYDEARDAARDYSDWLHSGGFCVEDSCGDRVVILDVERDRFGVAVGGGMVVDTWRDASAEAARMRKADAQRCADQARADMGEAQERNACRGDQ